ncbi:hypothetical protein [Novosphingopyxis sp.]|uniref:hypothetical protein n=1 Tax=Novosphingopyxis sp. TaxID=2709690 RepID=UPI003B58DA6B
MKNVQSRQALLERLLNRLYGQRLVRNVLRGELVEQMILDALGEDWIAGSDYGEWDVEHPPSGTRIQVKQSTALQSWSEEGCLASVPRYIIKATRAYSYKTRLYEADPRRHANIYIFAWHPLVDVEADHCDPNQWLFYIVKTDLLPNQQSIGLSRLERLCEPVFISELADAMHQIAGVSG